MRYLTRRVHIIRATWTRQIAIGFTYVVLLLSAGSSHVAGQAKSNPNESNPLTVYITPLDDETIVLVFRSPAPSRRVVVGIAKPIETDEGPGRGHLYQIPGFKEAVPTNADLNNFRAALKEGGPQDKYKIEKSPLKDGPDVGFEQINEKFLTYLRTTTREPGDLDVWDIDDSAKTRVVFLGDLVLVKPRETSTPQSKAEEAMVLLLANLALKENKGTRPVKPEGGCNNVGSMIENVQRNPSEDQPRRTLRQSLSGALKGARSTTDENQFEVTNTGWVRKALHLEVSPPPAPSYGFKVTSSLLGPDEAITSAERDLELPPCTTAQISVAPLQWYEAFPEPVDFKFDATEATLTTTVRTPGIAGKWIFIGLGAIFLVLMSWLFYVFWPREQREQSASRTTVSPGRVSVQPEPKRHWWWPFGRSHEKSEGSNQPEPSASNGREVAASLKDSVVQALQEFQASSNKLIGSVEASLVHLQSADQNLQEIVSLKQELGNLEIKHNRWKDLLKDLGNLPEDIIRHSQTLKQNYQFLANEVIEIEASSRGTVVGADGTEPDINPDGIEPDINPDGTEPDINQSLQNLRQTVPRLTKLKSDYEYAVSQIHNAVSPGVDKIVEPAQVALWVQQLRDFINRLFSKYAEPFQNGVEPFNPVNQSFADVQNHFEGYVKANDSLALLAKDERICRARLISSGMQKACDELSRIETMDERYASLFTRTEVDFGPVKRKLLDAANSSDATLTQLLSIQAQVLTGKSPVREDIDQILIKFFDHILSESKYGALLGMLRLWQVTDVYCGNSEDPLMGELYSSSGEFRCNCEQILSDLECLGVHFHRIHFLRDPKEQGLVFSEADAVPPLQSNPRLIEQIKSRLQAKFGSDFWKTVADVRVWGFECDLDPTLNLKTELWLWRDES